MDGKKVECEVGDVHHVLYYASTHLHHAIRTRVVERGAGRDGRVFPYVAHYLATGDMLYPVHEGEAMVTRLLQELTRLDLVKDLLRTPLSAPRAAKQKEGGEARMGGDTLKVNTRRRPLSFAALLTHFRPTHAHAHTPAVYRPPSNKRQGSTLVVVGRSALRLREVVVHGPRAELGRFFPSEPLLPAPAPAHAALDAQVTPTLPNDSTLSPAHAALSTLAEKGYTPTVRSSWVCGQSGALITQWLVYRRRGGRRKGGGRGTGGGVKADTHKSSIASFSSFGSCSKLSGTLSAASTSSLFSSYSSSSFPSLRRASSTTDLASVSTSSSFSSSSSSSSVSSSKTMRGKLKTRSKSILTLHDPPPRPSLTLKRLLSVFF